jgi:hypothetical protein
LTLGEGLLRGCEYIVFFVLYFLSKLVDKNFTCEYRYIDIRYK